MEVIIQMPDDSKIVPTADAQARYTFTLQINPGRVVVPGKTIAERSLEFADLAKTVLCAISGVFPEFTLELAFEEKCNECGSPLIVYLVNRLEEPHKRAWGVRLGEIPCHHIPGLDVILAHHDKYMREIGIDPHG